MLLGELLIQKKLITKEQLEEALLEQKASGEFLGMILMRNGLLHEEDLMMALAGQFDLPYVNLKTEAIDWKVATRFSSRLVVDRSCLPFRQNEHGITVAIVNPLDMDVISEAEKEAKDMPIRVALTTPKAMEYAQGIYRQQLAGKIKKMLE